MAVDFINSIVQLKLLTVPLETFELTELLGGR